MTDPVRLLDALEELTPDERRALAADMAEPSPLGAKRAVWGALALKLTAVSSSVAAAGTAAGSAAVSTAAKLSVSSLMKAAGMGAALGTAVSTGLFFGVPREPHRPAEVVVAATSAAPAPSAPRDNGAPVGDPPAAEPSADPTPQASEGSLPPSAKSFEGDGATSPTFVLENESQRVARARALLRSGDASRALELLRALEREEPRGLLLQEREALLIEALSAVGRRESARERAAAFLKRYPSSPHVRAVLRAAE